MRVPTSVRVAAIAAGMLALSAGASASSSAEQQFGAVIELLTAGQRQDAMTALERLTQAEPGFDLAKRLHGQLMKRLRGSGHDDPAQLLALAEESRLRLESEQAVPARGTVPDAILQVGYGFTYMILVDLPRARLYVLENDAGGIKLVRSHYASMGKNGWGKEVAGDHRTPVGLYRVTGWIDDRQLPDLYGAGAFPLDYPNFWDRIKNRTGSGIWLHGVPNSTDSRPPRSSEGCVTMANADLRALRPYIRQGRTPILLSDAVSWVEPAEAAAVRDDLVERTDAWRKAWIAGDSGAYLAFYAEDFSSDGMDRAAFAEHKRRISESRAFIDIEIDDLSLFRYPGSGDSLVLAEFKQRYRSDTYELDSRKQLLWKRDDDGNWKIFREEELR